MTPGSRSQSQQRHSRPDLDAAAVQMFDDVVAGLSSKPQTLPCKYFYDEEGSKLFDEITRLEEYYLTRAEAEIMAARSAEIATAVGPGVLLVEFGSGSSAKTRALLDSLESPAGYVPVDISGDYLHQVTEGLRARYPDLEVLPLEADFTGFLALPETPTPPTRRVVYFPGSTIGNFPALEAVRLLGRMRALAGRDGAVLVGFDRLKSRARLHAAYNDAAGVTARFNLNLLAHVNRVLGSDFDLDGFEHRAPFNEAASRIEMHLISRRRQTVHVGDRSFEFAEGDVIVTEHSHKYTREAFADLATSAGLRLVREWADSEELFCVQLLVPTRS